MFAVGLTSVPTDELERLRRSVHRSEVLFPLTADQLACVGLQHRSEDLLGALRGLPERSVRAILVCVLAERRA